MVGELGVGVRVEDCVCALFFSWVMVEFALVSRW